MAGFKDRRGFCSLFFHLFGFLDLWTKFDKMIAEVVDDVWDIMKEDDVLEELV